ncbi:hypothetical protein GCM10009087_39160 [Sphingomonas oligophenolica]
MQEKLKLLRARYHVMAPLLMIVLGVSLSNSPVLAWTAGGLLAALTINQLAGLR